MQRDATMDVDSPPAGPAVLFVSGIRTWRAAVRLALRALHCTPVFADTAALALTLAREADYARLFVDAGIPGGLPLVAALDARRHARRVVVLTQDSVEALRGLARHGALRAVHPKPATTAGLVALLRAELAHTGEPALIDAALVADLRATVPVAARRVLLEGFAREAFSLWRAAEAAREAGDAAALRTTLHRLRGAAASVGASALEARIATLGDPAPAADAPHCGDLIEASVRALGEALARP